ncbi:YwqJ-related putative deaminase [Actinophytocola oryzae]|uniref:YwqJ-like deaminase n=1 Tax=Actinophytocola oryzae TaxID=502181 RepID=A0A4R7UR25_9PSEU|nr:YwqJ-related putative deaminase [Actinophytocola oryzae]TDV35441.1 YwqJ-like deaminase [Actinophytocola oryzae]
MEPNGEKLELEFKEAVRKRVTFNLPDDGDRVSALRTVGPPQPEGDWTDRTGADSNHAAEGPGPAGHPLRQPTALENDSTYMGEQLVTDFSKAKRPGMSGALLVGDDIEVSSSMKGGTPDLHPLVAEILDELEGDGGRTGRGHGRCAEVGAISNHLWMIDPDATMTRTEAQAYFERRGAATIAHTLTAQDTLQVTAACPSCEYLTDKLCVATIRRPPPDMS